MLAKIEISKDRCIVSSSAFAELHFPKAIVEMRKEPLMSKNLYNEWILSSRTAEQIALQNIHIVSPFKTPLRIGIRLLSYDIPTDLMECELLNIGNITCEQEYLHNLIHHAPFLAFIKDQNANFIYANQKILNAYGCRSVDEIVGKDDSSFLTDPREAGYIKDDDLWVLKHSTNRVVSHEKFTPIHDNRMRNLKTWKYLDKESTHPSLLNGFAVDIDEYINERIFTQKLLKEAMRSSFPELAKLLCEFIGSLNSIHNHIEHIAVVQNDYQNLEHEIVACELNKSQNIGTELVHTIQIGARWGMHNDRSLFTYLEKENRFWSGDARQSNLVKTRHPWVKSIAAVPIINREIDENRPTLSNALRYWGYISCISSKSSSDQDMRRVVDELEHFAEQASKLLVICYNNAIKEQAEVKMFSLYVEGHEQDKRIGMGIVSVLKNEIEKLKKIEYNIEHLESAYRHSRKLGAAFDVSRSISKFAEAYDRYGSAKAIETIQSRVNITNPDPERTVPLVEILERIIEDQREIWANAKNGFKIIVRSSNLNNNTRVESEEPLLIAGITNIISNACEHAFKSKRYNPPFVSVKLFRSRNKVILTFENHSDQGQETTSTIKNLNDFFTDITKRPRDCFGWEYGVIKSFAIAYRGGATIKYSPETEIIKTKILIYTLYEKNNNCDR